MRQLARSAAATVLKQAADLRRSKRERLFMDLAPKVLELVQAHYARHVGPNNTWITAVILYVLLEYFQGSGYNRAVWAKAREVATDRPRELAVFDSVNYYPNSGMPGGRLDYSMTPGKSLRALRCPYSTISKLRVGGFLNYNIYTHVYTIIHPATLLLLGEGEEMPSSGSNPQFKAKIGDLALNYDQFKVLWCLIHEEDTPIPHQITGEVSLGKLSWENNIPSDLEGLRALVLDLYNKK